MIDKTRLVTLVLAMDVILGLFLLDQVSKWYVLEHVIKPIATDPVTPPLPFLDWMMALTHPRLPFAEVMVHPNFSLVMVWNTGVSFGVLAGSQTSASGILMLMLMGIVVGFGIWMFRTREVFLRFVLAAVIGGAMGNLWDRVRFGAVADFLDFHIQGWHYPAFNVADSCIVLGILALVGYELFYRSRVQSTIKGKV